MYGVDFCGVADLTPARDAILVQSGALLEGFTRAVSFGIALPNAVVDLLPRRSERAVAVNYQTHSYDIINQRLDLLTSQVSSLLQRQGWRAFPVPASKRVDDERICAVFSHKLAAHLAGLGWIGKSCLLVTPQIGPRVRWATVLTDATLPPSGEPLAERCGDCRECVDICPVHAFTGEPFRQGEAREVRYDAGKCDRYFNYMKKKDADAAVCGMCLYVCPYGRQKHADELRW